MRRGIFRRKKEDLIEASLFSFKIGYINLMKTLVPILLSMAVFSRLAVVDLTLPKVDPAGASIQEAGPVSPRLSLTVAIEKEGLSVSSGEEKLAFFPNSGRTLDLPGLSALMRKIKKDYPNEKEIVILSFPKTSYEVLIAVMDACRLAKGEGGETLLLFPDVSLGEISA